MATLNFDANTVEPNSGPQIMPTDWYIARVIKSEEKPNSKKTGSFLELEMEILDGPFKGSHVWDRLNLNNDNPVAQKIAYETLSAICHATGVIQVQDSSQLHNIPLEVRIKYVPEEGQYDEKNEVKGYRRAEGKAGNGVGKSTGSAPASSPQAMPGQMGIPQMGAPQMAQGMPPQQPGMQPGNPQQSPMQNQTPVQQPMNQQQQWQQDPNQQQWQQTGAPPVAGQQMQSTPMETTVQSQTPTAAPEQQQMQQQQAPTWGQQPEQQAAPQQQAPAWGQQQQAPAQQGGPVQQNGPSADVPPGTTPWGQQAQ